jgi:hypothetical protein
VKSVRPMDANFPHRSRFTHVIDPPFAAESGGEWLAVGIDAEHGLVLQYHNDPSVLRWIGQVVKFCPMLPYLSESEFNTLLAERGLVGVNWKGH